MKVEMEDTVYLSWEDVEEGKKYIDEVYGIINIYAKAVIKNERLMVITYKDSDRFPVSFDGMRIFQNYEQ